MLRPRRSNRRPQWPRVRIGGLVSRSASESATDPAHRTRFLIRSPPLLSLLTWRPRHCILIRAGPLAAGSLAPTGNTGILSWESSLIFRLREWMEPKPSPPSFRTTALRFQAQDLSQPTRIPTGLQRCAHPLGA